MEQALREIASRLMEHYEDGELTVERVGRVKKGVAKELGMGRTPGNQEVLAVLTPSEKDMIGPYLQRKPGRTVSGVAPIAVMTSPEDCPHGKCMYCPGGVENDTPQSYTGHEPAALRAIQNDYDAYEQVKARISQLEAIGHSTDKVDMIVMGGTFTSREPDYKRTYIKGIYDALNCRRSDSLESSLLANEIAPHRCIGLTIETRPDQVTREMTREMLAFGTTRVEIGVQTVHEDILETIDRGHTSETSIEATRLLKEAGLKVCYHMMPGLPGSTPEKDLDSFRRIFDDPAYRPDMLKVYPTLVIRGTRLHDMWERGEYEPLSTEGTVEVLAKMKAVVPEWVRIQRIQRDIPGKCIDGGSTRSNMRQLVQERMRELGTGCSCIRCRETGRSGRITDVRRASAMPLEDLELRSIRYDASGGTEVFISMEEVSDAAEPGRIAAYVRLRLPEDEALDDEWGRISAAGEPCIRELKVVGSALPLGDRVEGVYQHKGLGSRLLAEAETVASDEGFENILVRSGVGVREYYRARGYHDRGHYLEKST